MSDGLRSGETRHSRVMSAWARMLAEQAAALEKLRGLLVDYDTTLMAMRSAVALALSDDEQAERLREALRAEAIDE